MREDFQNPSLHEEGLGVVYIFYTGFCTSTFPFTSR